MEAELHDGGVLDCNGKFLIPYGKYTKLPHIKMLFFIDYCSTADRLGADFFYTLTSIFFGHSADTGITVSLKEYDDHNS